VGREEKHAEFCYGTLHKLIAYMKCKKMEDSIRDLRERAMWMTEE
jgi:hypothetical protein